MRKITEYFSYSPFLFLTLDQKCKTENENQFFSELWLCKVTKGTVAVLVQLGKGVDLIILK